MAYKEKKITVPDTPSSITSTKILNKIVCYETNPFLNASNGFVIKTAIRSKTIGISGEITLKNEEEDATSKIGAIWEQKQYDMENFIKFYTTNIKTMFDLTTYAVKVLTALFITVQTESIKSDEVFFTYDMAVANWKKIGIEKIPSRTTFSRGKGDLIKAKFICGNSKGVGWYFINPSIIFNGDRISFIKTAVLERKQENYTIT